MAFDYSKLREKIKEKLGSETELSKRMNIPKSAISQKLNGKIRFTQNEIPIICKILEIKDKEVALYFFK